MLEIALSWLPIAGGLIFAIGLAIWGFPSGNKSYAIWIGFIGVVTLTAGFSLHLQKKFVWEASDRIDGSGDAPAESVLQNRPWLGIDVEIAGPLTIENGISIPLKITLTNSAGIPATDALSVPMIFTRENQPFTSEEIIKRRSAGFQTGGGMGYSVFLNKPVVELNTPSSGPDEIKGQEMIAPFILVAVKYRAPGGTKTFLTANLYALFKPRPGGGAQAIVPAQGNVPANQLGLMTVGSYAD